MSEYKIETKCIHSGYEPKNGEPRELPIYQSTTYKYESSVEMAKLFDLEADGYFYSRLQNPTNDAVAAKLCAMEGGVMAMLTGSGQAASFFSTFNICSAGDHIIASSAIYGGTFNLFDVTMRRMGIETTFVSPEATVDEIIALSRPNTKLIFAEVLSNPSLVVLDIETFAEAAHKIGVPLIVDNTFPTPYNCRPFEFGADIVTHSTTKYLDGHASAVGGAIIDSGNFDWTKYPDKFACLCSPDESYHGVTYTEKFGKEAYIRKAVVQLMRDLGSIQSPFSSYLLSLGIESLPVRMKQHTENAQKIAEFLEANKKISWVNYPGLKSNRYYDLAKKYMPRGTSGVISFGVKGGREAATKFMDGLTLATIATHVADSRTCVLHPASTTHRQLNDAQLQECGVSADLIRYSAGIENADDLIADIEASLSKI